MPTSEQLLEARVMVIACEITGITQRDEFYRGHLATSDNPDISAVCDAVGADDEGLRSIRRFSREVMNMSDTEAKFVLQKLISQLTEVLQVTASGLRVKLDHAASGQPNRASGAIPEL